MDIKELPLSPATLSYIFFLWGLGLLPPKHRPSEKPDHLMIDPVPQGGRLTGVVLYCYIWATKMGI